MDLPDPRCSAEQPVCPRARQSLDRSVRPGRQGPPWPISHGQRRRLGHPAQAVVRGPAPRFASAVGVGVACPPGIETKRRRGSSSDSRWRDDRQGRRAVELSPAACSAPGPRRSGRAARGEERSRDVLPRDTDGGRRSRRCSCASAPAERCRELAGTRLDVRWRRSCAVSHRRLGS